MSVLRLAPLTAVLAHCRRIRLRQRPDHQRHVRRRRRGHSREQQFLALQLSREGRQADGAAVSQRL